MTTINQKTVQRCLQQIKIGLKQKGIKYAELATLLKVSTVTVKRMLNQYDIGLERLITLADIAGLNIAELIETARDNPGKQHLFSDVQDQAFFDNPHLLDYFTQLFYFNKSPLQIQNEHQLTDVSTYRYLRKLEDIELIQLLPQNKCKLRVQPPLGFAANSKVLRRDITHHIQATCEAVMNPKESEDYVMRVKPMRAPRQFYQQMIKELKKVTDRYTEIAEAAYISLPDLPQFQITIVGHPLNIEIQQNKPLINVDKFK